MDTAHDVMAAIRHGADAGGAAIAARRDPAHAELWTMIAEDQRRLAAIHIDRLCTGTVPDDCEER